MAWSTETWVGDLLVGELEVAVETAAAERPALAHDSAQLPVGGVLAYAGDDRVGCFGLFIGVGDVAHSVGHGELEFALGGAVVTSANRHVDHLGAERELQLAMADAM